MERLSGSPGPMAINETLIGEVVSSNHSAGYLMYHFSHLFVVKVVLFAGIDLKMMGLPMKVKNQTN